MFNDTIIYSTGSSDPCWAVGLDFFDHVIMTRNVFKSSLLLLLLLLSELAEGR